MATERTRIWTGGSSRGRIFGQFDAELRTKIGGWIMSELTDEGRPSLVYAGLQRLSHRQGAWMRPRRRGIGGGVAFEGFRRRVGDAVAPAARIRSDSDGRRAAETALGQWAGSGRRAPVKLSRALVGWWDCSAPSPSDRQTDVERVRKGAWSLRPLAFIGTPKAIPLLNVCRATCAASPTCRLG
jgi:hypothetical protein